jgi:hypothetical protein
LLQLIRFTKRFFLLAKKKFNVNFCPVWYHIFWKYSIVRGIFYGTAAVGVSGGFIPLCGMQGL